MLWICVKSLFTNKNKFKILPKNDETFEWLLCKVKVLPKSKKSI